MEGGRPNQSLYGDTIHDIRMTPTLKVLTSECINQYAYSRPVTRNSAHSPPSHVDVSIYRDTTANNKEVVSS